MLRPGATRRWRSSYEEEERSEWLFQTAAAGILEEICEESRPEDEVAFLLDDWDFERLTEEQRRLYDERIHPLMGIWFFERERFEGSIPVCAPGGHVTNPMNANLICLQVNVT